MNNSLQALTGDRLANISTSNYNNLENLLCERPTEHYNGSPHSTGICITSPLFNQSWSKAAVIRCFLLTPNSLFMTCGYLSEKKTCLWKTTVPLIFKCYSSSLGKTLILYVSAKTSPWKEMSENRAYSPMTIALWTIGWRKAAYLFCYCLLRPMVWGHCLRLLTSTIISLILVYEQRSPDL